jgi:hypothetical protein
MWVNDCPDSWLPHLQKFIEVRLAPAAGPFAFAPAYDVFGRIGTTFRELDWRALIFFERAVPTSPNAWYTFESTVQVYH